MTCYCGHTKKEHRTAKDSGQNQGECTHGVCQCESYLNPVYTYKDGRVKEKWHKNIDDSKGHRMRNTLVTEGRS